MIKLYFEEVDSKFHSESFARNILSRYLNVNSNSLLICKNEFGKPYLKDYPNVHYNISHTKGAIVCAVADEPVGVDIERVKNFNKRIAERFFTQNEQNYIFDKMENQNERFAEIWTMKEAYVKWLGEGMAIPFDSFDVLQIEKIYSLSHGIYYIAVFTNSTLNPRAAIEHCNSLLDCTRLL